MINLKDIITLIFMALAKNNSSKGMAVPKSRRSKSKGKTRLSNWKKKGSAAAKKAFSAAKRIFTKEKQSEAPLKKNEEIEVVDSVENTDTLDK